MKPESFNSKLLLFGEYGLMVNAMALSVPFSRFSGSLGFDTTHSHGESSSEIQKFYSYLTSLDGQKLHFPFDLKCFKEDLEKGLYFNSNIPLQYGLGSSGALIAALFRRYAAPRIPIDKVSIDMLKVDLAQLEAHFHGKSSGLDPLVSFLNQPLLLNTKKMVKPIQLDMAKTGLSFALIDTHTTGATCPLVQHFIDSFNSREFASAFASQFIPANNGCIETLLTNDHSSFFSFMEQLVGFQLEHFRRMIPSKFYGLISEALSRQVYIKLLGSGGGGYLLAITASDMNLDKWAESNEISMLKLV